MRAKLALLLVPVLVYGGSLGYLRYKVTTAADDAIRAAAPFAEISYRSVHTSALGDEVGLDDVLIKPVSTGDEFRIERLRFKVPHIGYFLSTGERLKGGRPPKNLRAEIGRLELDINSPTFDMLDRAPSKDSGTSLDAYGCGDLKTFSLRDFRRMGIGTTITDLTLSSTYDDARNNLRIKFSAKSQGLGEMQASGDFAVDPQATAMTMPASDLRALSFGFRDTGYYKLRNDYCARLNGGTAAQYVARNLELILEEFGVTLPDEAADAYKGLMNKGGELQVQINPGNGIRLADLQHFEAAEMSRMLAPKILINGTPLDVDKIDWKNAEAGEPRQAARTRTRQLGRRVAPPSVIDPRAAEPAQNRELTFVSIPVSDVHRHQGKMLEVTMADGRVRKGRLQRIEKERLYLTLELKRGAITFPVKKESITAVKVQN